MHTLYVQDAGLGSATQPQSWWPSSTVSVWESGLTGLLNVEPPRVARVFAIIGHISNMVR